MSVKHITANTSLTMEEMEMIEEALNDLTIRKLDKPYVGFYDEWVKDRKTVKLSTLLKIQLSMHNLRKKNKGVAWD